MFYDICRRVNTVRSRKTWHACTSKLSVIWRRMFRDGQRCGYCTTVAWVDLDMCLHSATKKINKHQPWVDHHQMWPFLARSFYSWYEYAITCRNPAMVHNRRLSNTGCVFSNTGSVFTNTGSALTTGGHHKVHSTPYIKWEIPGIRWGPHIISWGLRLKVGPQLLSRGPR